MTTAWRKKRLAEAAPPHMPGEAWEVGSLCIFSTYPRRVREALYELAESNPTPSEYERRRAEILGGSQ